MTTRFLGAATEIEEAPQMSHVLFEGCSAWPLDNEIITLALADRAYDLHNDADFREMLVRSDGDGTVLQLLFSGRALPSEPTSAVDQIVVKFHSVSDLRINVRAGVSEAGLFHSFEYAGGRQLAVFTDVVDASFQAQRVSVMVTYGLQCPA